VSWLRERLRSTWVHRLLRRPAAEDANAAYDRQTVEVMRRVLRHDSMCVDVGAHRGDILGDMIRLAPDARHHAFEALPHLAEELRRRFPRVEIHAVAVSDRPGRAEFQHVENDPGYSGLRRRQYDRPDPRIVTIEVETVTLDTALAAEPSIAFLKIDVEGGEYHVLRGAVETVRRCRPVIVFEAGRRSTGEYGVTARELFAFVTGTLGDDLSTMGRWLAGDPAYTLEEFEANWERGPDYYFIAVAKTG
jgi:FkbM family methyltransferase